MDKSYVCTCQKISLCLGCIRIPHFIKFYMFFFLFAELSHLKMPTHFKYEKSIHILLLLLVLLLLLMMMFLLMVLLLLLLSAVVYLIKRANLVAKNPDLSNIFFQKQNSSYCTFSNFELNLRVPLGCNL